MKKRKKINCCYEGDFIFFFDWGEKSPSKFSFIFIKTLYFNLIDLKKRNQEKVKYFFFSLSFLKIIRN